MVTEADISLIAHLIKTEGDKGRSHISRRLCRIWDWRQSNGHYKEIACRELLRRLENRGLIKLPPMLNSARKPGYKNKIYIPSNIDTTPLITSILSIRPIEIKLIKSKSDEKLYNGLIGVYHYLGYKQANGEQLKYLIYGKGRLLGCIGYGVAAWKVACRDQYIGWSSRMREDNLFKIVNNNRFLILPWIKVHNLASYILSITRKCLKTDWQKKYCHSIVLLETFVERDRFLGTCYQADNWHYLGKTTGRGSHSFRLKVYHFFFSIFFQNRYTPGGRFHPELLFIFFLIDSPFSSILNELCINRSQIASAMVGLSIISYHF